MFGNFVHRPRVGRSLLALAGIVVLGACPAWAGLLGFRKAENLMWFGQIAVHGPAAPPHVHAHPGAPPRVFWNSPFAIRTWAFPPFDMVAVSSLQQHRVAPHAGEPAPGPAWRPILAIRAVPVPRWVGAAAFGAPMHGPWHADFFSAVLLGQSMPPGVITRFQFIATGRHDPGQCTALAAICTGEESVPPTTSQAAAGAALVIDAGTFDLGLSIVAMGIERSELLHAAIFLGRPGEVGTPIFDLGPPSAWEDLEGYGIGRTLDVPFPPQYFPALVNGETYISLATMRFPQGEVRGQIHQPPPAQYQIGDLNCDGRVDFDDINPFVMALSDPAGYEQAYPNCLIIAGDINMDGAVNFEDINPFVALLTNP
ncbi:MAG: CHRD domain-containing protein [Planctomycetota bacterium]